MDIYEQAVARIIKAQESIIGPMAIEQAKMVSGIQVDTSGSVHIQGDGRRILQGVVDQFSEFFGHASILVCRDAVKEVSPPIPLDSLPDALK